jgi:2OG-Fe(II) oxygenase superfamily
MDELERVTRSLLRLGASGGFAACHREPALGLGIDVNELGHLPFPLEASRVEALKAHATASRFGYRDQTLHDTTVRDSWEIPGSKVHLDDDLWRGRMQRGLTEITESLGLADAEVTPILDKLLIYPAGGFFAPHRDSQKTAHTAGTLVVVLPSVHEGGEVVVSHAGRAVTFSTVDAARSNYLSFLGFYADCVHETKPVRAGHRVALSYRLEVEAADPRRSADDGTLDLERSLSAYFDDDEESPWLVYLFEHQYAQLSFGWEFLKSGDRLRADAIRRAASRLDLGCFLALADVHEAYQLGEEGDDDDDDDDDDGEWIAPPPSDRLVDDVDLPPVDGEPNERARVLVDARLPRSEDEDAPEDELTTPPSESETYRHLLGALTHRELTLEEWMDDRGELCEGIEEDVYEEHVVTTTQTSDRTTYEASYEPWTGNEGGDAQQWYRQTVLVVMPKRGELYEDVSQPLAFEPEEEDETPPRIVRRAKRRPG